MLLDGLKSNGPIRSDKASVKGKAESKPGGKSFADALTKAKAVPRPTDDASPVPAQASPAAPVQPAPSGSPNQAAGTTPSEPAPSAENYLQTIRFRLQSGYYDNPKVDDALSDKLSGYFDEAAD